MILGLPVSGHPEEGEEDAPVKTPLHVADLGGTIQHRIELARGKAQVGIQTLVKRLIKYHLAQPGTREQRRECHTSTGVAQGKATEI